MTAPEIENLVTLTIDDHAVAVPRGTTIIEAAKKLQTEIPHYCYHPDLKIVGNCRICQVEVQGAPKLMIACHTQVQPDMVVRTHLTSEKVKAAQADTLELILINHPLDCTICDASGHCKLQDYHYEYNGEESRFIEEKENKVKSVPLGPTVMLDGERCIMCTRCIRFCDDVTETSELGMLNRGDKSVIAVNPGKQLDNPLSGSVVDLCPVGALTHREWRFNTRIWYTNKTDTICTGCSTGCNVSLITRDAQVTNVKARYNAEINKEWLCDEGRYGFERFLPEKTLTAASESGAVRELLPLIKAQKKPAARSLVLLAGDLLFEDLFIAREFVAKNLGDNAVIALAYGARELTKTEQILINPNYAANYRAAEYLGLIDSTVNHQQVYEQALSGLCAGEFSDVFVVGDRAILPADLSDEVLLSLSQANTIFLATNPEHPLVAKAQAVLPARSVYQKSGMLLSEEYYLQYAERAVDFAIGTHPHWRLLNLLSEQYGSKLTSSVDDRAMTLEVIAALDQPEITSIKQIKTSELQLIAVAG